MKNKLDHRGIQKVLRRAVRFGTEFDLWLARAIEAGSYQDQINIEEAFPDWVIKFSRDKEDFWDERAG
jgi:hypothetical protein